ncbi:uncharacterized protein LOC116267813 isoform X2 [Nymphaea colorata]|uniref:uncharacterized protein LOC116267813 isoform X2 n=1 Tax=Nymphaea colorata TaxID=210225 RepID=UPI00214E42C4|nr:uncharacterized protein LOC116267813 isoform X2 [Nymphaea colorata]
MLQKPLARCVCAWNSPHFSLSRERNALLVSFSLSGAILCFSTKSLNPKKLSLSARRATTREVSTANQDKETSPLLGTMDTLVRYITGKSRATEVAHAVWQHIVQRGDTAIDATCGNGFDTLALLKMVSDESRNGCVLGLDVQQSALDSTSSLLNQSVDPIQKEQVKLFLMCHSRMQDVVPKGKSIRLIAFNLGYLPRGDKTVTTVPETTFQALQSATEILDSGGLISIIAYVGHPGGRIDVKIAPFPGLLKGALPHCEAATLL